MTEADNEIFGLLAEATAIAAPSQLGDLVLQAATSERAIGQAIAALGGGEHADSAVAYVQTVDVFKAVVADAHGWEIVEPSCDSCAEVGFHRSAYSRLGHRQVVVLE